MYRYQDLEGVPLGTIAGCLNSAFSDYPLPVHLSEADLAKLCSVSGVDRKLSFGAFSDGVLVGCILDSCGLYQGHRVVFDVATGVIPAYQGKQVFTGLFSFALRTLEKYQIERYHLEVLQQNERAIALYKRLGFSISRELIVLSGSASEDGQRSGRVRYASFAEFDLQQVSGTMRNEPSYEHSDGILELHPELYSVAYIEDAGISAWCVFLTETGQIFQLGCRDMQALKEVVQALLVRYPHVTIKNLDSREQQVLELLTSLRSKVVAKQYEMVRDIR